MPFISVLAKICQRGYDIAILLVLVIHASFVYSIRLGENKKAGKEIFHILFMFIL